MVINICVQVIALEYSSRFVNKYNNQKKIRNKGIVHKIRTNGIRNIFSFWNLMPNIGNKMSNSDTAKELINKSLYGCSLKLSMCQFIAANVQDFKQLGHALPSSLATAAE